MEKTYIRGFAVEYDSKGVRDIEAGAPGDVIAEALERFEPKREPVIVEPPGPASGPPAHPLGNADTAINTPVNTPPAIEPSPPTSNTVEGSTVAPVTEASPANATAVSTPEAAPTTPTESTTSSAAPAV